MKNHDDGIAPKTAAKTAALSIGKAVMRFVRTTLTWWNGATPDVLLRTMRRGTPCGVDEFGHRYYRDRHDATVDGKIRRWVVFEGEVDASRIPPEWRAWLQHTDDGPPPETGGHETVRRNPRPHEGNPTGTNRAHRHPGPRSNAGRIPWKPE